MFFWVSAALNSGLLLRSCCVLDGFWGTTGDDMVSSIFDAGASAGADAICCLPAVTGVAGDARLRVFTAAGCDAFAAVPVGFTPGCDAFAAVPVGADLKGVVAAGDAAPSAATGPPFFICLLLLLLLLFIL